MNHSDFLPRKDADFLQWTVNFSTALAKIAARIGFPDQAYQQLVLLKNIFSEKFNIAEAPETRTGPAIRDKTVARTNLEKSLRQTVGEYLTRNHLLTDTDRENLGLPVHKSGRTPSPVADRAPDIEVDTSVIGRLNIHFFKKSGSHKKSKPAGQHCAEMVYSISDTPPARWDELIHSVIDTNSPFELTFENDMRGKTVYFAIRWEKTRGGKDPWSEIMNAIIP